MKKNNFNLAKAALAIAIMVFAPNINAEESKKVDKKGIEKIPFTAPPAQRQWRVGFRANDILDMIEIQPSRDACDECDRLSGDVWPHEKTEHLDLAKPHVLPLPFRSKGVIEKSLINPEKWFVTDLKGNKREISVNRLAAVFSQVSSGCCYMTTEALSQNEEMPLDSMGPSGDRLFVAFTSKPDPFPVMRRTETKQKVFLNQGGEIPKPYLAVLDSPSMKKALGEKHQAFKNELSQVYTQEFEACVDKSKGVEKLSITGWVTEDFSCAFAILKENEPPLAIHYKSRQAYNDNFKAKIEAASDLDGNGTDEIITSVTYSEGNAFKIFTLKDGQAVQLYETGYYGL